MSQLSERAQKQEKQLDLKEKMMHRDMELSDAWQRNLVELKVRYEGNEEMSCKDAIAELYGVMAFADKNDRKI